MKSIFRRWQQRIIRVCLPGICVLCDLPGSAGRDLCAHCHEALPWNHQCCYRCAQPTARGVRICGGCGMATTQEAQAQHSMHPAAWPINRTIAPLLYTGAPSRWVQSLKFNQSLVSGRLLGELLADAVALAYPISATANPLPDVLVPIPLHWRRLFKRGLNQAQILAEPCARRFRLPILHNRLQRKAGRKEQHRLSRSQRLSNLQDVYLSKSWSGEHIALIDDVVTTGATGIAAARACLAAGAARVDLWCITRTPPPLYLDVDLDPDARASPADAQCNA